MSSGVRSDSADPALALYEAFDWAGAEALLSARVAQGGPRADDLWLLAMAQRRQRRFEPALGSLTGFLAVAGADPRLEEAHAERLHCVRKLERFDLAVRFGREAADAFPRNGYFARVMGEALLKRGRPVQAERWLRRALRLDPSQTEARSILLASRAGEPAPPASRPAKTVSWPSRLAPDGDLRRTIRGALLRGYDRLGRFVGPDTRFLALGSCFAHNLAARLQAAGYAAHSEFLAEEVNSTFANRYLLEWVERGPVDLQTEAMHEAYGEAMREVFIEAFRRCDVFIFTLGLAPAYFSRADGGSFFMNGRSAVSRAFLRSNYDMRSTSVAENQANIAAILDSVRRLSGPGVRAVVTVSPVPLGATSEFDSAVIADCISKSTLRVACHEALRQMRPEQAVYWPSFEMVRWLGGHFGHDFEPAFGGDDGHSRHVSMWLVDTIVSLFLETFCEDPGQAGASGAGTARLAPTAR